MTENTTTPNGAHELNDDELQQVSGGKLPENILAYCDLLDPEKKQYMERTLAKSGEEVFLTGLMNELKLQGQTDAANAVRRYLHETWLPSHY